LQYNVSFWGVIEFMCLFIGMVRAWFAITLLYNRFHMKDMLSRIFFVALFTATVLAAIHLDDGLGTHGPGHFTALAAVWFLLAIIQLYIGSWIDRVERLSMVEAGFHIASGVYNLLIAWLPLLLIEQGSPDSISRRAGATAALGNSTQQHLTDRKTMRGWMAFIDYIWFVFFAMKAKHYFLRPAEYDEDGTLVRPPDRVPWHIDLMNERFCLLIVIVLGEGVLGIIVPDINTSWKETGSYAVYCTTAGMACVVLCCLQFVYFEVDNVRFEVHAMQRTMAKGIGAFITVLHPAQFWLQFHVLLMNANLGWYHWRRHKMRLKCPHTYI